MTDFWTTDRVQQLRDCVAEGMTATQIARAIGAVSREAIIGKCSRMGLKLKSASCMPAEYRVEVRKSDPVVVLLEDATAQQCRWPLWPNYGDVPKCPVVCGAPVAIGPYCAEHASMAYPKRGIAA